MKVLVSTQSFYGYEERHYLVIQFLLKINTVFIC